MEAPVSPHPWVDTTAGGADNIIGIQSSSPKEDDMALEQYHFPTSSDQLLNLYRVSSRGGVGSRGNEFGTRLLPQNRLGDAGAAAPAHTEGGPFSLLGPPNQHRYGVQLLSSLDTASSDRASRLTNSLAEPSAAAESPPCTAVYTILSDGNVRLSPRKKNERVGQLDPLQPPPLSSAAREGEWPSSSAHPQELKKPSVVLEPIVTARYSEAAASSSPPPPPGSPKVHGLQVLTLETVANEPREHREGETPSDPSGSLSPMSAYTLSSPSTTPKQIGGSIVNGSNSPHKVSQRRSTPLFPAPPPSAPSPAETVWLYNPDHSSKAFAAQTHLSLSSSSLLHRMMPAEEKEGRERQQQQPHDGEFEGKSAAGKDVTSHSPSEPDSLLPKGPPQPYVLKRTEENEYVRIKDSRLPPVKGVSQSNPSQEAMLPDGIADESSEDDPLPIIIESRSGRIRKTPAKKSCAPAPADENTPSAQPPSSRTRSRGQESAAPADENPPSSQPPSSHTRSRGQESAAPADENPPSSQPPSRPSRNIIEIPLSRHRLARVKSRQSSRYHSQPYETVEEPLPVLMQRLAALSPPSHSSHQDTPNSSHRSGRGSSTLQNSIGPAARDPQRRLNQQRLLLFARIRHHLSPYHRTGLHASTASKRTKNVSYRMV